MSVGRGRGWRILTLLAALFGLGVSRPATAANPGGDGRQILVMLHQPPEHLRPGSDYGGSYGDMLSRSAGERISRHIARMHGLRVDGDWPMPLLGVSCFIMTVADGRTAEEVAAEVSRDPGVAWSQPMHEYRTKGTPVAYNDPLFPAEPAARLWHLAEMHRIATGKGISVAVIDTRVDGHHPDLAGQIVANEDFVTGHAGGPESHGTGVAGVIAAKANNAAGIVGIAPEARIMALRACWQLPGAQGSACDSVSLAKALHFAIEHRVQVINLSLGGPPDLLLSKLIDIGIERGETFVAAYDPATPDGGFPASHPGVIAVADTAMAMVPRGVYTAPGRDIPTTEPGGRWYLVDGSSYAAAHVSGLIALLREHHAFAVGVPPFVSTQAAGGAINALASLQRISQLCDDGCGRQLAANTRP